VVKLCQDLLAQVEARQVSVADVEAQLEGFEVLMSSGMDVVVQKNLRDCTTEMRKVVADLERPRALPTPGPAVADPVPPPLPAPSPSGGDPKVSLDYSSEIRIDVDINIKLDRSLLRQGPCGQPCD